MSDSVIDTINDVESLDPEDRYPNWDKARHRQLIGRMRFVGPGGHIFPEEMMGPHWTDPRLERQICHGLDKEGREVWKRAEDKPLPGFVSLQASDSDEGYDDNPIPYDYELPPYASASSIAISNFDQGNPVGEMSRDPVAEGDDGTQLQADFDRYSKSIQSDPDQPAS